MISNFKILFYSIVFFLPLIIWFFIILTFILPSTRKTIKNFILRRNSLIWKAVIFTLMFYLSSLLATYCYGIFLQITKGSVHPEIFEGLSFFILLLMPLVSLSIFFMSLLTLYLIEKKWWGLLLSGIIYGFVFIFLLSYITFSFPR